MAVASALVGKADYFRAGLWKPRTRPGCFEGVGKEGLLWMRRVRNELSLPVATEVATAEHVELALSAGIDLCGWVRVLRPILLPCRRLPMRCVDAMSLCW